MGAVSVESNMLLELYHAVDGFRRLSTPDEYLNQLDYYVEAFKIIDNEFDGVSAA